MIESEKEARETTIELIDKLIDIQKKNISQLEFMKEHVNDMSSEQFKHFGVVLAIAMAPSMMDATLNANSVICATNETIVNHVKKEVE